jgi:hypothetical protein
MLVKVMAEDSSTHQASLSLKSFFQDHRDVFFEGGELSSSPKVAYDNAGGSAVWNPAQQKFISRTASAGSFVSLQSGPASYFHDNMSKNAQFNQHHRSSSYDAAPSSRLFKKKAKNNKWVDKWNSCDSSDAIPVLPISTRSPYKPLKVVSPASTPTSSGVQSSLLAKAAISGGHRPEKFVDLLDQTEDILISPTSTTSWRDRNEETTSRRYHE